MPRGEDDERKGVMVPILHWRMNGDRHSHPSQVTIVCLSPIHKFHRDSSWLLTVRIRDPAFDNHSPED